MAPLVRHTPCGVASEVAKGTGWWLGTQACHRHRSPLPPCQGRPVLSQQNWKVFHSHLFIKAAPFFPSLSTRTELGQHPRLSTLLTTHSNINDPMHHPQDSRLSPGQHPLAILPHDALMFGVFFLLQDSKPPNRLGLLYYRGMTNKG